MRRSRPPLAGTVRRLRAGNYSGAARLAVRAGSAVAMTHLDDADASEVTSVCLLEQWSDWALSVGHSTVTEKAYLYRLQADMSGWYDASGDFHANQRAEPCCVIWDEIPLPPDVRLTEGLGYAYIAHCNAADNTTLAFPSKKYTIPATIETMTADLDGDTTPEDLYFLGVIAFNQHLWGWGVGSGTTPATHFRPELLRFSQPFFGDFVAADSITVGDRTRSQREKVVGAAVAGEALFIGSPFALTRITGFGRNSWYKKPLDKTYGFPGPKCFAVRGDTLYFWSNRGPIRVSDAGEPEHLWPAVDGTVLAVIAPEKVTAGYDESNDIVMFAYDKGDGVRTWAGFDCSRDVWVGPDDDLGLKIRYISTVTPVYVSAAAATSGDDGSPIGDPRPDPGGSGGTGPIAAPAALATTAIGPTTATAQWTNGDIVAQTQVEIRRQVDTAWTVAGLLPGGVSSFTFTGLINGQAYEWRVAHLRSGIYSDYVGPTVPSQFTTGGGLLPPASDPTVRAINSLVDLAIAWVNSGEADVLTDVELSGPSSDPPDVSTYLLEVQIPYPQASAQLRVGTSGIWWVRIRHTRPGYTASTYTGPTAVSVDGTPFT
jgi:hypothetical protein